MIVDEDVDNLGDVDFDHNIVAMFLQGGMKAVLWTDTVQMVIVFGGMLTLVVIGSNVLGGLDKAWDIADRHGRIVLSE